MSTNLTMLLLHVATVQRPGDEPKLPGMYAEVSLLGAVQAPLHVANMPEGASPLPPTRRDGLGWALLAEQKALSDVAHFLSGQAAGKDSRMSTVGPDGLERGGPYSPALRFRHPKMPGCLWAFLSLVGEHNGPSAVDDILADLAERSSGDY